MASSTEMGSKGALSGRSGTTSKISPSDVGLSGQPVQVVKVVDNSFELDEERLKSIIDLPEVKNKPVVIISVAGAFRKGKSFLLNFFIRYLNYASTYTNKDHSGWLDDENLPLAGFAWRGGSERETTGILMWSEPFILPTSNGEQVVVLLMDTQGAFDTESTVKECATIFALSTMISSVQVYNLHSNIQENDLQHLQLFTEYGRLAVTGDSNNKPFQSLLFLVRDWSYPYDYDFGIDGGNALLEKRLMINPNQHHELQLLRQQIRSCFETIDCFLMPHPGLKVATNPRFDGRLKEIDSDFRTYLQILVPQLLSTDNLIVKEICGNKVTGSDLFEYFKVYMRIFQGDTLPEPKSIMQATAEANNLVALTNAKELYTSRMEAICGGDRPFLHPDQLNEAHGNFKEQALMAFHAVKKIGGEEFSTSYVESLIAHIDSAYENYSKANEAKSMLRSMRTPITLFVCFVVFYFVSGVFTTIGVSSIASLLNALVLVSLVLLATWGYCRQTGELREVGTVIDNIAQTIWDMGLAGPMQTLSEQGISTITGIAANRAGLGNLAQTNQTETTSYSQGTAGTQLRHRTSQPS